MPPLAALPAPSPHGTSLTSTGPWRPSLHLCQPQPPAPPALKPRSSHNLARKPERGPHITPSNTALPTSRRLGTRPGGCGGWGWGGRVLAHAAPPITGQCYSGVANKERAPAGQAGAKPAAAVSGCVPGLNLPVPTLEFTPKLVAVQLPHPPSVLSLSNQILQA